MLLKSSIVLVLIISGTLTTLIPITQALPDLVTATNTDGKTLLRVTNSPSSSSDIASLTLEIKNGNFKSFTLGNGWIGKKTSPTTIAFFSSNPIKPGDSTTITISTDQPNPDLVWIVYDINNNQLGSGETEASIQNPNNNNQTSNNVIPPGNQQNTNQPSRGILDTSTFRIIPSTPAPGFDVRVVGQSFTSSTPLDLYLSGQKIYSFASNSNGNFVVTTTIPQTVQPGNVDFILKDQANNQKTFSTTILPPPPPRILSQSISLTVNVDAVLHPGDTSTISGTANPGSTVTITISDPNGTSITTFTASADTNGKYSVSRIIPNDTQFGKYTVSVSDEKNQASKEYTVVTAHQLTIETSQKRYNPGDTVVINGTSISNLPVSIVIIDQTGNQVFAKDVNVTTNGKISTTYPVSGIAVIGTYVITATQGRDQVVLDIGVGEDPVQVLSAHLDKLNYLVSDRPVLSISGTHSSTLNLVIIAPDDQEKFSDIITLGQDGFATYSFNLTSYTPGVYSLALTRGNDKTVLQFAVGLQTGCGQITLQTTKDSYYPGDSVLLFGKANPDCLLQVSLTDPNGIQSKAEETFVDKSGIFHAFNLRIPDNGMSGTWKLDATSGIDHKSLAVVVKSVSVMTVTLDKTPPVYNRGDLVQISGGGAGQEVGVIINILGASNTPLQTLQIQSTNRGDYNTEWLIPKSFGSGTYTIQVSSIDGKVTTPITIQ